MRKKVKFLLAVVLVILTAWHLQAQTGNEDSRISGQVTSANGELLQVFRSVWPAL
jgi:hypothetical protein